ncbi:PIG-L deacetylase family protein [Tunicatimonas pelagia]|uniref:PIG-L deacetylase family protein n=1 Tax=Tunicatimonas pelagia TaxID=931531 RepID=UPI002666F831|nr:PIG-L family deacetylase [Tunicatimonas pelagia]WKN43647.1 hypothetical protein P0M28_01520 [Tunicatimonas pelagia]
MFAHQKILQGVANESLLYPAAQVYDWGSTLVVSPHPTADVLGCGGAMALLRQVGFRVRVVFLGDGRTNNAQNTSGTTEITICQRMERVGISSQAAVFLNLRAGFIPAQSKPGYDEAVRLIQNELEYFQPDTILLPFLKQGNSDGEATWQLVRRAAGQSYYPIRMVEYCPWSGAASGTSVVVSENQPKTWRLDIKEVIDQKVRALDGHWQPEYGFPWRNPQQEMLVHQANPWETYREYPSSEIPYSDSGMGG